MKLLAQTICVVIVAGGTFMAMPAQAADDSWFWKQLRPAGEAVRTITSNTQSGAALPIQPMYSSAKLESPTWMMAATSRPLLSANASDSGQGAYLSSGGGSTSTVEFEVVLGWDSEHVFRGTQQAKQNVTGGIEARFDRAYAGAWAVLPTADSFGAYQNRIDLYAGYGLDLSDTMMADIGITGYIRPDTGLLFAAKDSVEIFGGISGDGPLRPAVYAFYDFVLERAAVEASAEYMLPVGRTDLVFGGTAGYTSGTGIDYGYLQADVELVHNFNRNASVAIGGHFAASTETTFLQGLAQSSDRTTWFGLRLRSGY